MNFELVLEPEAEQAALAEPDFARWRSDDGEVRATFHRRDGGYLVRFLERADFAIPADTMRVACRPAPGVSSGAVRDLYLNQVLPMLRGHHGELVIHASAVDIAGRAVGFVAATGRGKSTLAAAFARAGHPFLSDDGLGLVAEDGGYRALPNRPSFRLRRDSEAVVVAGEAPPEDCDEEKSRVPAGVSLPFRDCPVPLAALYFLGEGDAAEPRLAALPGPRVLAELINHSFFLDAEDRVRMARHLEALAGLAVTVPAYELDFPREYERLPSVIEAVSAHLANVGEGVP